MYSETILTQNVHPGDSTTETITGEKYRGDGYYGRSDGFHTVQYNISGFIGKIDIQATLAVEPTESDYFTISDTALVSADDSSGYNTGAFIYNFTGNYVWVRAYVTEWTDGDISSIQLNH
tara:strand:- start:3888 stop:4247 length:360 start_codon:yes stop_codon:yes gene_type:complete